MIEYIGKNHLDSNFYKKIFIRKDGDYIEIETVNDKIIKNTAKLDTMPITAQIKNLDDYNKIKEIISYFLRNNIIFQVAMTKDNKFVATSTSNRSLILDLDCDELEHMVIKKYLIDRLKFLDKQNKQYIYFTTVHIDEENKIICDISNYYEGHDRVNYELEGIILTLMTDESNVAEFDKLFMIEYIKEILNNTSEKAEIWNDNTFTGIEIRLPNKVIRVPGIFKEEISILINNRNNLINEMNNKQYKLEGIKWNN